MTAALDVRNLTARRGGRDILRDASFEAGAGEFIGVIGANGAGKTTLLRALVGVETPSAGAVRVMGEPVAALSPSLRARRMSYLPQARPIYWSIEVERLVALGRFAYGAPSSLEGENAAAVERAIAAADLGEFRRRAATSLSGGEAARAHLARALAAETPILIADEPTAALDPRHQLAIMRVLRTRADAGGLVIAALHDLALAARYCTRIMLLEDGRLTITGAPDDVLTSENLSRAFGVDARVARDEGRFSVEFE